LRGTLSSFSITAKVFPNCPRYIHRLKLVARSAYVPQKKRRTLLPDWKRRDWVAEVLPDSDPARQPRTHLARMHYVIIQPSNDQNAQI
jgi:hypothetical protein